MNFIKIPLILEVRIPVPSVELSILRDNTVLIAFSERVAGFTITDISIAGGTLENFSGNGQQFLIDVVKTDQQASLSIPAGVVMHLGQLNTVSNTLVI